MKLRFFWQVSFTFFLIHIKENWRTGGNRTRTFRLVSENSTTEPPVPCWANRCLNEDTLVKYIWWKKRGTKGHTNNTGVSALPWLGTPWWDDDIIPSEWSASNLVKGFDWMFFCFCFCFFLSFSYLTLSQSSFTFLCFPSRTYFPPPLKRKAWEEIIQGNTERRKHFISLASFLPIVAFLDKSIVSSYPVDAAPRYHQRLQEINTALPPFSRIWSSSLKTAQRREPMADFKRSPSTLRSRTTRYSHGL